MYKLSIYLPQIPGQARNDVYLQKPVIAVLDTAIYPQICKKDCHVFSQRILPREQAKVCDCHPERRTVTLNCYATFARTCYERGFSICTNSAFIVHRFRVKPGMTAVTLNSFQGLYKYEIVFLVTDT